MAVNGVIIGLAIALLLYFIWLQVKHRSKPLPPADAPDDGQLAPTVYVNPGLLPDAEPPRIDEAIPLSLDLDVLLPKLTFEIYELGKPKQQISFRSWFITIGRSEDADIRLTSGSVFQKHATVSVGPPPDIWLQNCAKAHDPWMNPPRTCVNGKHVVGQERLHDSDEIVLGDTRLIIHISRGKDASDLPPAI